MWCPTEEHQSIPYVYFVILFTINVSQDSLGYATEKNSLQMCGLNKITNLPFCLMENPLWVYTALQGSCPPQAGFVPQVVLISRSHPGNSAFHDRCGKGREARRINTCSWMLHPRSDTHFVSWNRSHGYLTSRGWKNIMCPVSTGGWVLALSKHAMPF